MFRITRDPSSGSFIQCLAKITQINIFTYIHTYIKLYIYIYIYIYTVLALRRGFWQLGLWFIYRSRRFITTRGHKGRVVMNRP